MAEMKRLIIGNGDYEIVDEAARNRITTLEEAGTGAEDGFSPIANVTQTATGAHISITDKDGTTTADVSNGTATDEQVAAWLDAHPEATTTVADESITKEKLAFTVVEGELSPNLIDTSLVTSARFTNVNGAIQSFSSGGYYDYWRMTDYIDVSDHVGEYISMTNHNGYCFYTAEKTAIAGSGESLGMNYPANSSTDPILIPSGAYYVRLVYWYRDKARYTPMANFGETLLEYADYGVVALPNACVFNDNIGEKIRLDNIESETLVEKVVSNNLIPPTNIMVNYKFDTSTGEPVSVASGYYQALTDWIPVKEETSYFGLFKNDVAFYDAGKAYLGHSTNNPFTTPYRCAYVRLVIDGQESNRWEYPHRFYLVEGSERPANVDPYGSYISKDNLEMFSSYKSVLNRLEPLYNPTIKTAIGIYGDSNTAGLISGATGRYYENCWANLLCSRILDVFDADVTIYPIGKYGSWYGRPYSGALMLDNISSFVSLEFYGTTLKVNFGQVQKGVASITIDGGEPVSYDTNNGTQYIAEGLSEGEHTVVVTRTSGVVQVSSITIHKYVTATNKGSTGSGTAYLPTADKTYDIYLTVLGTNNRGSRTVESTANDHFVFAREQMKRGAEVILITPTPATDGFETGVQSGLKMADIEAAIAEVNGICNLEHISFYQYLLSYCTFTGTSLNDLFNDTLHMKESTHGIIYKFMCDKLGLGQPINDYLPNA